MSTPRATDRLTVKVDSIPDGSPAWTAQFAAGLRGVSDKNEVRFDARPVAIRALMLCGECETWWPQAGDLNAWADQISMAVARAGIGVDMAAIIDMSISKRAGEARFSAITIRPATVELVVAP